jgi:predicted CXXCH cytochrome family protein
MKKIILAIIPITLGAFFAHQQAGTYWGVEACTGCHSGDGLSEPTGRRVLEEWQATAHATAFDNAIPTVQNSAACIQCHTTGFDSTMADAGSDDFISWTNFTSGRNNVTFDDSTSFGSLTNVQCEACHGPANGNHPPEYRGVDENPPTAAVCGTCHQDAHHPYYEEWSLSAHSRSLNNDRGLESLFRNNAECSGCHTMQGFIEFVGETPADTANTTPSVSGDYGDAGLPIECAACHDPHPAKLYDGQLRLPKADLCVKCHNPEDAQPGQTVHHATSSMWAGEGAVEFTGFLYLKQSAHQILANDACVTCHVFRTEGDFSDPNNPIPTAVGHTFEPRLEACGQAGCHVGGFSEVGPYGPFDYKGRQTFTDSLTTLLRGLLENVTPADSATQIFAEAVFNLEFNESSRSSGVHNPNYAQSILEATIQVVRDNLTVVAVEPIPGAEVPQAYALHQNYPNPFNPATVIEFEVPAASFVSLRVFDSIGRHVATLVSGDLAPNRYKVDFSAESLPSGLYFYQLDSGETSLTKKMLLVK